MGIPDEIKALTDEELEQRLKDIEDRMNAAGIHPGNEVFALCKLDALVDYVMSQPWADEAVVNRLLRERLLESFEQNVPEMERMISERRKMEILRGVIPHNSDGPLY